MLRNRISECGKVESDNSTVWQKTRKCKYVNAEILNLATIAHLYFCLCALNLRLNPAASNHMHSSFPTHVIQTDCAPTLFKQSLVQWSVTAVGKPDNNLRCYLFTLSDDFSVTEWFHRTQRNIFVAWWLEIEFVI